MSAPEDCIGLLRTGWMFVPGRQLAVVSTMGTSRPRKIVLITTSKAFVRNAKAGSNTAASLIHALQSVGPSDHVGSCQIIWAGQVYLLLGQPPSCCSRPSEVVTRAKSRIKFALR